MPKFSIIVPCYRAVKYIDDLMTMMHSNKYSDYEVIFVDDCSPDNTYNDLINKAKCYDNYIIARTDVNGGPGIARNKGLDIAKGKYIIFTDCDDVFDINSLIDFNEIIDEKEQVDLIVNLYSILRNNKTTIIDHYKNYSNKEQLLPIDVIYDSGSVWNKVFNKQTIDSNNLRFNSRKSGEDQCFLVEYLVHAKKIYKSVRNAYTYVMNNDSLTHKKTNKKNNVNMLTSFEVLELIYKEYFPEILVERYVNTYLLAKAKMLTDSGASNKTIKHFFVEANKKSPNWINNICYKKQNIYRKLIYKAMYNSNPILIRFLMWIRRMIY